MAAQDTWEKKDKGREDSAEIQGFLQNVRTAAPSADACWEALPWFWNKWVPDFAEKDSHFGEKRRSESVQRLAMFPPHPVSAPGSYAGGGGEPPVLINHLQPMDSSGHSL